MCDVDVNVNVDDQIVGECVEVQNEAGEKLSVSEEGDDEDEVDTEGASHASDVVDAGKLCKKWESYLTGHKLER